MPSLIRNLERARSRAGMFVSVGNAGRLAAVGMLVLAAIAALPARAQTDDAEPSELRSLGFNNKAWSGDFDGMLERRLVRVAVPYGRTLFYHDRGRERGLTADVVRKFEEHLNKKHKKELKKRPITIVLIPTTRDQLIPALLEGRADIAAGNITITEGRSAEVDFSGPIAKPFSEIIVTGPGAPALSTLDDLAGQEVFVRPATSYHESLTALNARFQAAGKPPMTLTLLPDPIEDEDKLDMINAGLLGISAVDEWLADVWSPLLPQVVAHKDMVLRSGGEVGWAFRKGSPRLQAEVDDFITNVVRKYGLVTGNLKSFSAKLRKTKNAKAGKDWERFQQVVDLFRKYGDQYGFDYLLLAAQGYQESQLDQSKRSPVGATGIMQLMPATGKEMKVGDIGQAEPNVHAGTSTWTSSSRPTFPMPSSTTRTAHCSPSPPTMPVPAACPSCVNSRPSRATTRTSGSTTSSGWWPPRSARSP